MLKSLAAKVLIGLVLGMAAGIAVSVSGDPALLRWVGRIEPIGTLWVNAIRMTVLPLVVGAIVVGVASAPDLRTVGSLGGRAGALFLLLLGIGAAFGTLIAPAVFSYLSINPAGAAALREGAALASAGTLESAQKIQSVSQWLLDLVPTNPVKAAADGAMLPLIVFSIAFAIALTRVAPEARDTLLAVMRAVMDTALVLVHWILWAAPLGVFVLSAVVATRLGLAAAGAVVFYIATVAGACMTFIALLYALVWLRAHDRLGGFPRLWAPAQSVAFSARSSLVALPAMIEAARTMRQPQVIQTFLLPLAVATFRVGSAINIPIGVLFLARLYGVDVGPAQLLTIAVTSVVTTFSVPGIPGGSIIVMVPVLLAARLPVEGIGILLAVDTLPDMFRTLTNTTGHLTAAAILSSTESSEAPT